MSLADTFERVRTGLVHILFVAAGNPPKEVANGTGFLSNGFLITNNHVFAGPPNTRVFLRREGETERGQSLSLPYADFRRLLVTGSDKNSYDYAVLRIPELIRPGDHQFKLVNAASKRVGDPVGLIGFPLNHLNLTCHSGIISSFFESNVASFIQVDASVNAGNSGGPLIDPETGDVLGIVTRKGTGLTHLFEHLRQVLRENIQALQDTGVVFNVGGVDPMRAIQAGQQQMLVLLDEIERQANVGIGYAVSSKHLLEEPVMQQGC
jgi:S1-C subfamily serine protease